MSDDAPRFLLGEEVVHARREPAGFESPTGVVGDPGDWLVRDADGEEWAATDALIRRSYEPVNKAAVEALADAVGDGGDCPEPECTGTLELARRLPTVAEFECGECGTTIPHYVRK